jgi:pyruvate dehydrogenase E1 component beta subunit
VAGVRPFVDLGTGSFPYLAWSQIVNEAAVSYYMSDGRIPVPVTFHLLHGVRGAGAPQHSHSPQAMLCNAPGLEIVAPATAADVYGLVRAAFASQNPTVVVSHAKLLGIESEVPAQRQPLPLGRADIKRSGRDVTIVLTRS